MSNVLLRLLNVKKRYAQKEALKGITLDIFKGEILGLLGVNGAGKTTLSSIIATLHPATSGEILHEGKSIYDDITTFRHLIGFCPQKPNLNNLLTVEQNLLFAGRYYGIPEEEVRKRMKTLM